MGEVISSEMFCNGNKQASAMMETADNKRGENMYEKHYNCLPNKSQIKNPCQIKGVAKKDEEKISAAGFVVSHLLGPEPFTWFQSST